MLKVVVSCEHGGCEIPEEYAALFKEAGPRLNSHEGYDIGALDSAFFLSEHFSDRLFFSRISRLLVDLNRSILHPKLFSNVTKGLNRSTKTHILDAYYFPYRHEVEACIREFVASGNQVLHLCVHSFTPVLFEKERTTDIGFLYDPKRASELDFCLSWKRQIHQVAFGLRVRSNYPYQGKSDGFATFLRKKLTPQQYLGIELEINQRLLISQDMRENVLNILRKTLQQTLNFEENQ